MEVIQGGYKTLKSMGKDVISNMPDIVMTDILDRLPLQDAVRTGILSRNWRFKWTLLSRVVVDEGFFEYLSKTKGKVNYVRIICKIIYRLKGAVTKFDLSMDGPFLNGEDIHHFVMFLFRKGVKDLSLINKSETLLKLSTHILCCLDLTHLTLYNCCFGPPFHNFRNVVNLRLCGVHFGKSNPGEFFRRFRSLESLDVSYLFSKDKEKMFEIAQLQNLKILRCILDSEMITNSSTIFDLVGSLPNLQELDLDFFECKLTKGGAKKRFPTSFPRIKVLKFSYIDLDGDFNLSCAFELIRSSPNIESLKITTAKNWDIVSTATSSSLEVDYSTMGSLQLQDVDFGTCCYASENDLSMIKYLVTCSPYLKKFVIDFHDLLDPDDKFIFVTKVLKIQRAHPAVDIDIC